MSEIKYKDSKGNIKTLNNIKINSVNLPDGYIKLKLKRGKFISPSNIEDKTEAILKSYDDIIKIKADASAYDDMKFYRWVYNGDIDRVFSYEEEYRNYVPFYNDAEISAEYIRSDEEIEKNLFYYQILNIQKKIIELIF